VCVSIGKVTVNERRARPKGGVGQLAALRVVEVETGVELGAVDANGEFELLDGVRGREFDRDEVDGVGRALGTGPEELAVFKVVVQDTQEGQEEQKDDEGEEPLKELQK